MHEAASQAEIPHLRREAHEQRWSSRHGHFDKALVSAQALSNVVVPGRLDNPEDLPPGCGAVQQAGKDKVAVYKDENGVEHTFSAVCPHVGCLVQWNPLDGTFGAPHDSAFTMSAKRSVAKWMLSRRCHARALLPAFLGLTPWVWARTPVLTPLAELLLRAVHMRRLLRPWQHLCHWGSVGVVACQKAVADWQIQAWAAALESVPIAGRSHKLRAQTAPATAASSPRRASASTAPRWRTCGR